MKKISTIAVRAQFLFLFIVTAFAGVVNGQFLPVQLGFILVVGQILVDRVYRRAYSDSLEFVLNAFNREWKGDVNDEVSGIIEEVHGGAWHKMTGENLDMLKACMHIWGYKCERAGVQALMRSYADKIKEKKDAEKSDYACGQDAGAPAGEPGDNEGRNIHQEG